MKTDDERNDEVRKALDNVFRMEYDEAFYRVKFGPEKERKWNEMALAKMRHRYFSM